MTTTMEQRIAEIREAHAGKGFESGSLALASYFENEVFSNEINSAMRRGLDDLIADNAVDRVLQPGATAPDFELNNQRGEPVRLGAVLNSGPVVLVFYRGMWCPYCNLHLAELQRRIAEINAAGATLLAVSPQKPDNSQAVAEANGLGFPVLSDPGNKVADSYGLGFEFSLELRATYLGFGVDLETVNDGSGWRLPLPGTFIIGQDGMVIRSWADADYKRRAEPDDVMRALSSL